MSISMYQSKVGRLRSEIATLSKKLAREQEKEAKKNRDLTRTERSAAKSTSASILRTKVNKADSLRRELAKIQKTTSDLQGKIASKTKELHVTQQRLQKLEVRQDKKRRAEELK